MKFPYHAIPDGSVFHPHHFVYAALFVLLLAMRVWDDDPDSEPFFVVGGISLSLFSWYHLWAVGRPVSGAVGTLVGICIAFVSPLVRPFWRENYSRLHRGVIVFFVLLASDDVLQHAFGIWTPADWVWKAFDLSKIFQ